MKRRWRVMHKWIGVLSCLFMLLVSGTALALNHRELWIRPEQRNDTFNLTQAQHWAVDPFSAQHLIASDDHYLWRSRDHGRQWVSLEMFVPAEKVVGIAFDPIQKGKLWVALRDAGVYTSDDGGDIWEEMTDLPFDPVAGEAIRSLHAGPQEIWVQSEQGLYHYRAGKWRSERLSNARQQLSAQSVVWQLHTGQFWGPWGIYLYDAVAFALIFLSLSGLYLTRKPRRHSKKTQLTSSVDTHQAQSKTSASHARL